MPYSNPTPRSRLRSPMLPTHPASTSAYSTRATCTKKAMAKFDAETAEELERPIKKGTLCAALNASDKSWYRARVIGTVGKDSIEVYFIDYGNRETVRPDMDMRKLPAHLLAYEPQAIPASFAFLKCPRKTQQMGA